MRRPHPPASDPWLIRRVFQQHEDGCGIACVAMLAGISYREACQSIFGDTPADATSYEDLRWALLAYGFRVPKRLSPFWDGWYTELRQPALLALDPMPNGMWHWAVWDGANRRILDPLRRLPRKPVVVGYSTVERRGSNRRGSRKAAHRPPAIAPADQPS